MPLGGSKQHIFARKNVETTTFGAERAKNLKNCRFWTFFEFWEILGHFWEKIGKSLSHQTLGPPSIRSLLDVLAFFS